MNVVERGITGAVREIKSPTDPLITELKLPMFTAYLANRAKNPADFLVAAQHLRQEGLFVEARQHLLELQSLREEGKESIYVREINKLQRSMGEVAQRLLTKYGVSGGQGIALAPVANVALQAKAGFSLPEGALRIPRPSSLSGITDRWGFRGIFRSVTDHLVSIERLGALHEVITSAVKTDRSAGRFNVHKESSSWIGRNAWFKRYL